jgi:hypothetical protein
MKQQRQYREQAETGFHFSCFEELMRSNEGNERENDGRRAEDVEALSEQRGPERTPQDLKPERHGRHAGEGELAGVGKMPGRQRKAPVVIQRKIACGPHDQHGKGKYGYEDP